MYVKPNTTTAMQAPPLAPSSADIAPATLAIVPSPIIDPNPVFFFGTGDGSAGYYAEDPGCQTGDWSAEYRIKRRLSTLGEL
jgi:hypothetical protein